MRGDDQPARPRDVVLRHERAVMKVGQEPDAHALVLWRETLGAASSRVQQVRGFNGYPLTRLNQLNSAEPAELVNLLNLLKLTG